MTMPPNTSSPADPEPVGAVADTSRRVPTMEKIEHWDTD